MLWMLWCLVVSCWEILGRWWCWIRCLHTSHLVEEAWPLLCWRFRACQCVRKSGMQFWFFLNITALSITLSWYHGTVPVALWTVNCMKTVVGEVEADDPPLLFWVCCKLREFSSNVIWQIKMAQQTQIDQSCTSERLSYYTYLPGYDITGYNYTLV